MGGGDGTGKGTDVMEWKEERLLRLRLLRMITIMING